MSSRFGFIIFTPNSIFMKSLLYSSALPLLLAALMMGACVQKTDILDPTYEPAELFGQEFLNSYVTPLIMFQYVSIDQESNAATGWMIDNKGNVHQYQLSGISFDLEEQQAPIPRIENILAGSTVKTEKVNINEMVEQYKKTYKIDREKLEILPSKGAASTEYFLAYDHNYNGQCEGGVCPGVEPSKSQVNQFVLKVEGLRTGRNSSIQAQQMTEWLVDLKSGF